MSSGSSWRETKFARNIAGRSRLILAVLFGVFVYEMLSLLHVPSPPLAAWNAAIVLYLTTSAWLMWGANEHIIRSRAAMIDESRHIVMGLAIAAVVVAFAAIIFEVREMKMLEGSAKFFRAGLAGLTIVTGWALIHTIFAQHYAHEYFLRHGDDLSLAKEDRCGLRFPGGQPPDYSDFLYFSFVIGVAAQTADVAITSKAMRRINLFHCVLAFFFNATVLALTINIAASLIAG